MVSEFITVDGVMENPGGSDGSPIGGWAFRFNRGPEGDRFKLEELQSAEVLLLGRRTYEDFAAHWPGRTDEQGFAEKLNSMPKYVVSQILENPKWNNTHVLGGDVIESVARLKREIGGEILVNGSCTLVHALISNAQVDEVRLMVYPIVVGSGRRLFADSAHAWPFRLIDSRPVGEGVLIVRYEPLNVPAD